MTKETGICNWVKTVSSINGVGKTKQIHAKNRPLFYIIYINSKCIKDFNIKLES